jgi:PAS domain S-box-containing protein
VSLHATRHEGIPLRGSADGLGQVGLAAGVGLGYLAAGKLGLGLALIHPSATVVWPPTGIALAALLLLGRHLWPAVLAAAFLVNLTTAGSAMTSLGIAVGNTLEAVIGVILVQRFASGTAAFDRASTVFRFAVAAGIPGPALSATIGVASLCLGGFARWETFPSVWLAWWAGDLGGALVLAPFLIVWARAPLPHLDLAYASEAALVLASTAAVGLVVFGGLLPFEFLAMVPILWAAVRLGERATSGATLLLAGIGVAETLRGRGPFQYRFAGEPLLELMVFLVVTSVGALAVAALMLERGRAEQELRRLAQIVASSPDAIVGATSDGIVTSWNAAAERLYGVAAAEMVGRPIRLGNTEEDTQSILRRLASGGPVETFDTILHGRTGASFHVSLSVSCVRDGAGRIVGIASRARDMSDRLRLAEARQQAAGLATENRKVQEGAQQKARFVSHVSHELRTPLTSIIGFTDMMREGRLGPLTELQRRCLDDVEQSGQHLVRLVDEVLDLAQLDAGRLEIQRVLADVGGIVEDAVASLKPQSAGRQIRVTTRCAAGLEAELLDPGRLRQVLYNFISNAIKFTPEGGSVEVRAELEGLDWWRLEVEDSGAGVPADLHPRLFREFERLGTGPSSTEKGIGLGLAITKRIVEAQGGSVGYRQAEKGGSVFFARWPRALRGERAS